MRVAPAGSHEDALTCESAPSELSRMSRVQNTRLGVGVDAAAALCSWLVLGPVVLLGAFVLYMTFVPSLPTEGGWTLRHWANIGTPWVGARVIPNTIIVGVSTTVLTTSFAVPLAWLLNRAAVPLRSLLIALIGASVIVPGYIKAMGWIMLVSPEIGVLNRGVAELLGREGIPVGINNVWGISWVMGLMLTPTMFFLLSGPMRSLDPVLEEAASVCGVGRWNSLTRVTLPLLWPGLVAGMIYTFMTAVSIFEVPAMLGAQGSQAPVLATELFYAVHPEGGAAGQRMAYGAAGVYGVLIAAPSFVALFYYFRVIAKERRYEVVTGRGYRPGLVALGGLRWAALGFILLYLMLAVGLPILVLVWASLVPVLQMPSIEALSKASLDRYRDLIFTLGGFEVIRNTALLIVSVAVGVVVFSFLISWSVVRARVRFRQAMDTIAMLPHAIPGVAYAFALFMVGLVIARYVPWFPLLDTLAIIVIAHVLNCVPFGTRITNAALLQLSHELEESAQVCGATVPWIWWKVVWPLIRPSLVFAGLWTAMLSFRELTMGLFLSSPGNAVVSVKVFQLWRSGLASDAAAGGVAMVVVMALILLSVLGVQGKDALTQRRGPVG